MKKLIILAALASFNTLAVDLSASNNYYCTMAAYTEIFDNKAKVLSPKGFVVKVTAKGSAPYITILQDQHSDAVLYQLAIKDGYIIANDSFLTFRMTKNGNNSEFPFIYHKFAYNKPGYSAANIMQQMSSGTCYII
jgi:hypothetical protein